MKRWLTASLVLGTALLAFDQGVKLWVERAFALGESVQIVDGCFALTYVRNQGAAWGMFQGAHYALAAFGALATVLLCLFWRKLFGPSPRSLPVAGMLLSGIVGNLIDRVRLGYVVDFIHVYWRDWHFPCFNIADSAICVAVALLFLANFLPKRDPKP